MARALVGTKAPQSVAIAIARGVSLHPSDTASEPRRCVDAAAAHAVTATENADTCAENPVTNRLRVELQQLGDLSNGQKRVHTKSLALTPTGSNQAVLPQMKSRRHHNFEAGRPDLMLENLVLDTTR